MQAGTPGGSLSPASPPGWTRDTPLPAVGLLAWCCVTLPGSCHLCPGVAGLHRSSVACRRWPHGLGGQLCWDPLLSWFYLLCPVPFGWMVPKSEQNAEGVSMVPLPVEGECAPAGLGAGARDFGGA